MTALDVRPTAVAGTFYPDDPARLDREVAGLLAPSQRRGPQVARARLGVVAPHAGYVYSGGVAGAVYAATVVPDDVVVLAPNHTGRGRRRALWARGAFALPGGEVPVDEPLARKLLADGAADLADDREAHLREHALEVQLPFLRARNPRLRVVPVVLGPLDAAACVSLGEALARDLPDGALVVASSDMSHYLDDAATRVIDRRAIDRLLALDPEGLHATVEREGITMCGYVPATVMLAFARARGATAAMLVDYATSGDAFGDRARVVGYAGVVVE